MWGAPTPPRIAFRPLVTPEKKEKRDRRSQAHRSGPVASFSLFAWSARHDPRRSFADLLPPIWAKPASSSTPTTGSRTSRKTVACRKQESNARLSSPYPLPSPTRPQLFPMSRRQRKGRTGKGVAPGAAPRRHPPAPPPPAFKPALAPSRRTGAGPTPQVGRRFWADRQPRPAHEKNPWLKLARRRSDMRSPSRPKAARSRST